MQEVLDRARLADASEIGARGIQATVSRGEIEDVLKSKDGDPELVLDVTRGGESETSTLRLVWDAGELEQLLKQADGDNVTLMFDGSELERALEDDVAAHGLREVALVLAVAATTAASGAAISHAALAEGITGSSGGSSSVTSAQMSEREWPVGVNKAAVDSSGVISQREWPVGVDKAAVDSSAIVSQREWPVGVSGTPAATPSDTSATTSTSAGTDAGTADQPLTRARPKSDEVGLAIVVIVARHGDIEQTGCAEGRASRREVARAEAPGRSGPVVVSLWA